MSGMLEVKNAIITSARFDTERGLSAYITLDYGNSKQGFGGFLLYAPSGWKAHNSSGNFCGHFIWRVLEVAGVDEWAKLPGRSVRVRATWDKVHAIGHIVKDDWFDAASDFKVMQEALR